MIRLPESAVHIGDTVKFHLDGIWVEGKVKDYLPVKLSGTRIRYEVSLETRFGEFTRELNELYALDAGD